MTDEVLFSVEENGVASITLNRPKAINSLSYDMLKPIGEKLKEWEEDAEVLLIVLKGSGTKGLCAGGDVKTLYAARSNEEAMQKAEHFFELEYEVDQSIYRFPKPIIACLDGIVMGGGVGLSYGASHRIVTDKTKWSMPEMNIGLFPDVGAAYFLNKAPGHVGRYLALTASVIGAQDVLYINAADRYMSSEKLQAFLHDVEKVDWQEGNVHTTLNQLINEYAESPTSNGKLAFLQKEIDEHFSFETVEAIIDSLEKDPSDFTTKTKEVLLSHSPVSLKVTLKQMVEGAEKSIGDCFATDLVLAKNFMRHPDFFEGVRSVLIDKDKQPQYVYRYLSDVTEEMVDNFFLVKD
ncbi:enoyl-CoA hydratase/isomerase family protein [Sutcliffiella halmapala]|uniref:enoyl-CoA hydratase/isomerase family protein n=1 Tax=Sutcliffiella halmapala TaxID=79882 RepID=UPI0009958FF3|nr:enoyl-CoA hydratase/isomerase family protein [Sutcliffiella halmapala]